MKLGARAGWLVAVSLGATGCGYEPMYGGQRPAERLSVVAAPALVPRADAVQAALAGARSELGRAGVLASGTAFPRMELELVRIDESSSGIAATASPEGEIPLARGSSVGVVGHAWVIRDVGAAPSRDTGDVRRVENYENDPDARAESARYAEAIDAASRAVGEALARRVLGEPGPGAEPM